MRYVLLNKMVCDCSGGCGRARIYRNSQIFLQMEENLI